MSLNVSYFKIFCCKYFTLNKKDVLGKFDVKSYEDIFIGYSSSISMAYRVFIRSTLTIEESMHVKFEESNSFVKNIVDAQIETAGEELKTISLKNTFFVEVDKKMSKLKKYKENMKKPNNYLKIGDILQVTPRSSLLMMFSREQLLDLNYMIFVIV